MISVHCWGFLQTIYAFLVNYCKLLVFVRLSTSTTNGFFIFIRTFFGNVIVPTAVIVLSDVHYIVYSVPHGGTFNAFLLLFNWPELSMTSQHPIVCIVLPSSIIFLRLGSFSHMASVKLDCSKSRGSPTIMSFGASLRGSFTFMSLIWFFRDADAFVLVASSGKLTKISPCLVCLAEVMLTFLGVFSIFP